MLYLFLNFLNVFKPASGLKLNPSHHKQHYFRWKLFEQVWLWSHVLRASETSEPTSSISHHSAHVGAFSEAVSFFLQPAGVSWQPRPGDLVVRQWERSQEDSMLLIFYLEKLLSIMAARRTSSVITRRKKLQISAVYALLLHILPVQQSLLAFAQGDSLYYNSKA